MPPSPSLFAFSFFFFLFFFLSSGQRKKEVTQITHMQESQFL